MFESTVTSKGQVTIPVEFRRRLGLQPREKVVFEFEGDAIKIKRGVSKILAGYGAVRSDLKPMTREDFEEEVASEVISEG